MWQLRVSSHLTSIPPTQAAEILHRLHSSGATASPYIYDRIAKAYARRNNRQALQVLQLAKEHGCVLP